MDLKEKAIIEVLSDYIYLHNALKEVDRVKNF